MILRGVWFRNIEIRSTSIDDSFYMGAPAQVPLVSTEIRMDCLLREQIPSVYPDPSKPYTIVEHMPGATVIVMERQSSQREAWKVTVIGSKGDISRASVSGDETQALSHVQDELERIAGS